jgi:CO/xanthine dehydrogenase FAD-binding subunit
VLVSEVSTPFTISETLTILKRYPNALISAGSTSIMSKTRTRAVQLPPTVISLQRIQELKTIARTDRYVELGAMTTLSELLALKESMLPEVVRDSIANTATFSIRNMATIGGSIMRRDKFLDPFPALACVDALLELRTSSGSSWVNANRIVDEKGRPSIPSGSLLTRIRIPAQKWDFSVARKYGYSEYPSDASVVFVCVCRFEKRTISDIKIMEAGTTAIRSPEAEIKLLGRRLPISQRDKESVTEIYMKRCGELELSTFRSERFVAVLSVLLDSLEHGTI